MPPKNVRNVKKNNTTLVCHSCNEPVSDSISCNRCLRIYHPTCITLTEYRFDDRLYTACSECLNSMQRLSAKAALNLTFSTPSSVSTPVRSTAVYIEREKFDKILTFMNTIDSKLEKLNTNNSTHTQKLDDIQNQLNDLKLLPQKFETMSTNFTKLTDDVTKLTDSYATVDSKCITLQNEFSNLRSEFDLLKSTNFEPVLSRPSNRDREDTEIVISGCPKTARETTSDILQILENIAKALDLPFSQSEIFSVYRIALKKKSDNHNPGPGPIIVRFISVLRRNDWIAAKKLKRDLKASEISSAWSDSLVSSSTERKLFSLTRSFAQLNNLHKPWMRRGVILLKISDDSPPVKVTCQRDLDELKAQFSTPTNRSPNPHDNPA